MARRDPTTHPAAFLGAELGRGRVAAGINSQEALATLLGFDRTVITKVESGDRPPTSELLTAWCTTCGLDAELFGRLNALARRAHEGSVPRWFESWLEAESRAHTLRLWSSVLIPGLFQTVEYARELFLAMGLDEDATDDQVRARLVRQEILERSNAPRVCAVLYEAVLRNLVGSPRIMHDALVSVASAAQRPNVTVQVVPLSGGANAGLGASFCLASGDGATNAPNALLMESVEDMTTEARPPVRRADRIFARVQADALPRAASRDLILEVAGQWVQAQARNNGQHGTRPATAATGGEAALRSHATSQASSPSGTPRTRTAPSSPSGLPTGKDS